MKASLYLRVSTRRQKEEGASLETQFDHCADMVRQLGGSIENEYVIREDWPGDTLDRPGLGVLRAAVARGDVDAVVVYSTDRLARNPIHLAILAEEFMKHGAELVFVTEPLDNTPEGQLIRYVKGYAAQIEREKIADRMTRGKRARAMAGRIPGGTGVGLYGYRYIPGKGPGQGRREIDERQADVVRMIFGWVVEEGMGLERVIRRLNEMGIPGPKGGKWGLSTVYRLLRNPAYTGKTYAFRYEAVMPKNPAKPNKRYNKTARALREREEWIEIPGVTPAIIDAKTFELAQEQLRKNRNLAKRNAKRDYLLKGHIRCGFCGRAFVGHLQIGRRGVPYRQYRCSGKRRTVSPVPCRAYSVNAEYVESLVWERIDAVLRKPDIWIADLNKRKEEARWLDHFDEDKAAIEAQIARIDREGERLVRLYVMGEIDDDWAKREGKKLRAQKETLKQELKALETKKVNTIAMLEGVESAKELCDRIASNLATFTEEDRKLAIDALRVTVVVAPDGLHLRGELPVVISFPQSQ